jgi:hypothetical protein
MGRLWRDYNLSIVLLALFLASWIGQAVFQWFEMASEAQAHGQAGSLAEFVPAFFSATFENWQSEFLQLFTMVVLTSFLIHRGSHESKDQDEKVDQTLNRIEQRLERLEQAQRPRESSGSSKAGRPERVGVEDDREPVPSSFTDAHPAAPPTSLRTTQND